MSINKTKINLELGDIITFHDPTDDIINNHTFFIEYIDDEKIKLLDVNDANRITRKIKEGSIQPGSIESIDLLYRNEQKGYARQNDLLPGKWLNIYFGGDTPLIITGEITNLEEDMIEIKTFPDNDILYINFAYKGLPQELPIESFEFRQSPETKRETEEGERESDWEVK